MRITAAMDFVLATVSTAPLLSPWVSRSTVTATATSTTPLLDRSKQAFLTKSVVPRALTEEDR